MTSDLFHHQGNWKFSDDSDDEEKNANCEEVFEVEPLIETVRDQPPDIYVGAPVVDVKFHPNENVLAVGTIENEVIL